MTDFENELAVELSPEEMEQIAGGFKRLPEKKGFIIHKIKAHENLTRIAKAYGCSINDLLRWNPKITDKNLIYIGDYLYVKSK